MTRLLTRFRLFKDRQTDNWQAKKHICQKAFCVCTVGFRKRWQLRLIAVIEFTSFRLLRQCNKPRFEMLNMGLVQVLILARKDYTLRPKIFISGVTV